jgi:hypothetical protein
MTPPRFAALAAIEQDKNAVKFVRHQPTGRLICGDRGPALVHPGSTKPCCRKAGKKCGAGWRLVGAQTPAHGERAEACIQLLGSL